MPAGGMAFAGRGNCGVKESVSTIFGQNALHIMLFIDYSHSMVAFGFGDIS